ncbi:MAG: diguanylate cyclase domain protein, partial [Rhizobacter sp.]|nr:diguanylate cyclase domain protein [Rhizobacter sp.]
MTAGSLIDAMARRCASLGHGMSAAAARLAGAMPLPAALRDAWRQRSLAARIVTLFLGLLLAVQAASFLAIREGIDRSTRASIAQELRVGERVLRRLMDQNAQRLIDGATLLAADYGFRQALATNDAETISSVLQNHGERIGATVTALLDPSFALRAEGQNSVHALSDVARRLGQRAAAGQKASEVVIFGGMPYQAVLVPVRAPVLIGWVMMGFPLDQTLVDEMGALATLQVTLTVSTPGHPEVLPVVSTLAASELRGLTTAFKPAGNASGAPGGIERTVPLGDDEFSVRPVVLAENASGTVTGVLMASIGQAVARYQRLQIWLAALTLVGVGVFAIGCVITARRVTTPIRQLAGAAERLGRGDYDT